MITKMKFKLSSKFISASELCLFRIFIIISRWLGGAAIASQCLISGQYMWSLGSLWVFRPPPTVVSLCQHCNDRWLIQGLPCLAQCLLGKAPTPQVVKDEWCSAEHVMHFSEMVIWLKVKTLRTHFPSCFTHVQEHQPPCSILVDGPSILSPFQFVYFKCGILIVLDNVHTVPLDGKKGPLVSWSVSDPKAALCSAFSALMIHLYMQS